ncbi:MAG: hypothetical protein QOE80_1199 [Actinomycetota bacterium]|jgi:hypothetical protein|nr:hypothetical protein [Actinomycetota bacterium]
MTNAAPPAGAVGPAPAWPEVRSPGSLQRAIRPAEPKVGEAFTVVR